MRNLIIVWGVVFLIVFMLAAAGLWRDVLAYTDGKVLCVDFSELHLVQKKRFNYGNESRHGTMALADLSGARIGIIYYGNPSGVVLLRPSDNVGGLVFSDLGHSVPGYMVYKNRFTYFAVGLMKVIGVVIVGGSLLLVFRKGLAGEPHDKPKTS